VLLIITKCLVGGGGGRGQKEVSLGGRGDLSASVHSGSLTLRTGKITITVFSVLLRHIMF
jgi:hypothetical protein